MDMILDFDTINYGLFASGIASEIDANRPVAVFGALPEDPNEEVITATVSHAVLCYGYREYAAADRYLKDLKDSKNALSVSIGGQGHF